MLKRKGHATAVIMSTLVHIFTRMVSTEVCISAVAVSTEAGVGAMVSEMGARGKDGGAGGRMGVRSSD